jgi:hypothetical protein
MAISHADYLSMLSRLEKQNTKSSPSVASLGIQVEREAKLQNDIIGWLKAKGWYYEWSPMCSASSLQAGAPDFRIAAPGGVTYWIEAKSKTGKLKPEQAAAAHMLKHLGHRHAVVRSMQEFLDFVGREAKSPPP